MERRAERIVVVVFDGLRPDMIAGRMPHLAAFAASGVRFENARSVFPSVTRVATTSIATGCWPARHGIVDNSFHRPELRRGSALDTSGLADLELLDRGPGGVAHAPSLGDRLAAAGLRMGIAHGGSAGSAFLLDPRAAPNGHWTFSAHGVAATRTPEAVRRAIRDVGALPDTAIPKLAVVGYVAEVAIRHGLGPDGPDVLVVWLPEPDTSYHYRELGSAATLAAMQAADDAFARIVDAARSGPRGAGTAIIAMSDHGQISTTGQLDLQAALRADGFAASERPDEGDRVALTRGRSGELRLLADDPGLTAALVDWLVHRDEIGMVFARDDLAASLPGTLPLSAAGLGHDRAADLVYVCRCDNGPDHWALPGRGIATGGVPVGGGMHGGLNRHELATTFMVAAPDGARGIVASDPCAIVDVVPTILALLGLDAGGLDGTALALDGSSAGPFDPEVTHASRGPFRQRLLTVRRSGGRILLEGGSIPAVASPPNTELP